MLITFPCSKCGGRLTARESVAGTVIPCPRCGNRIMCPEVPQPESEAITATPAQASVAARWYHSPVKVFLVIFLVNVLSLFASSCTAWILAEMFKAATLRR